MEGLATALPVLKPGQLGAVPMAPNIKLDSGVTVTVCWAGQLLMSVTVTVYVPAVVMLTDAVVAPLLQTNVPVGIALAVNVTLVVTQVNGAGVFRVITGSGFTVTVTVPVPVQPLASETVTQ